MCLDLAKQLTTVRTGVAPPGNFAAGDRDERNLPDLNLDSFFKGSDGEDPASAANVSHQVAVARLERDSHPSDECKDLKRPACFRGQDGKNEIVEANTTGRKGIEEEVFEGQKPDTEALELQKKVTFPAGNPIQLGNSVARTGPEVANTADKPLSRLPYKEVKECVDETDAHAGTGEEASVQTEVRKATTKVVSIDPGLSSKQQAEDNSSGRSGKDHRAVPDVKANEKPQDNSAPDENISTGATENKEEMTVTEIVGDNTIFVSDSPVNATKRPTKPGKLHLDKRGIPRWPSCADSIRIPDFKMLLKHQVYDVFFDYPAGCHNDSSIEFSLRCIRDANLFNRTENNALFVCSPFLMIQKKSWNVFYQTDDLGVGLSQLNKFLRDLNSALSRRWKVFPYFIPPPSGDTSHIGHYVVCAVGNIKVFMEVILKHLNEDGSLQKDFNLSDIARDKKPHLMFVNNMKTPKRKHEFGYVFRIVRLLIYGCWKLLSNVQETRSSRKELV